MRILVCPADRNACGMYRIVWPAEILRAQGHHVEILPEGANLLTGYFQNGPRGALTKIEMKHDCDVVVLQRCMQREFAEAIPLMQDQGIAVVVELDDDFARVPAQNIAYQAANPGMNPQRNWEWLQKACMAADLVTCSSGALAHRYAPHGRVAVLNNCIPESYFAEQHARVLRGDQWTPRRRVRVGWSGSVQTHPGDLDVTRGGVGRAVEANGARFHVIGTGIGVGAALDIHEGSKTGWVELTDYPRELARLDVGIVPLKASAFNRAKSWLKGLEMAAVGVPFVASCTPEYERLAKLGAGRLAAKPKDWEREVSKLIRDRTFREDQADLGREVARTLTIEANAWRWLAAWSEAGAMRRAA